MILHSFRPASVPGAKHFQLAPNQRMLLMPVGDVHWGSEGFPQERFVRHIEWGVARNAYFLGMGDIFEFTSRSQRAVLYGLRESQRQVIDEQNEAVVKTLCAAIACSKGRWIGCLEGDHYHEFLAGTTSDQVMCRELGGQFLGTSTLLDLRLENPSRRTKVIKGSPRSVVITVFATHGKGVGVLLGAGLNWMERLEKTVEADIYLAAHNHSKASAPRDRLYRTPAGYLYHRTKYFARTGGFMRGYLGKLPQPLGKPARESRGSYIEQAAFPPTTLGGIVFSLGYKRITHEVGAKRVADFCMPDIHYSV